MLTERQLAEDTLLAAYLLGPHAPDQTIRPALSPRGQVVFDALASVAESGKPMDVLLVRDALVTHDGDNGAVAYLTEVLARDVRGLHAPHYADLLRRYHSRDELLLASVALHKAVESGDQECRIREHLEALEAQLSDRTATLPQALDIQAVMKRESAPSIPWAVNGLFSERDLLLIGGEGGTGKSMLAMDLSIALASGQQFLGLQVESPGPVLYLDSENVRPEVERRLRQLFTGRRLESAPITYILQPEADLRTPKGRGLLRALIEAHSPRWVVLDSWVRFLGGADENSNSEAALATHYMRSLRERYDLGWIVLAHLAKPSKDKPDPYYRVRGASDLVNSSDAYLTLEGDRSSPRRKLSPQQRRTTVLAPMDIQWLEADDEQSATISCSGTETGSAEQAIRRYLAMVGEAGATRQDIRDYLQAEGYSDTDRAASRALGKLRGQGTVKSVKEGRSVRIHMANQ